MFNTVLKNKITGISISQSQQLLHSDSYFAEASVRTPHNQCLHRLCVQQHVHTHVTLTYLIAIQGQYTHMCHIHFSCNE